MFDPNLIRPQFPALAREVDGRPALFLDGPGGTQAPACVGAAMADYLRRSNANLGGAFVTSQETVAQVAETRLAMAAFLGAAPEEIVFGQNMTSLTFAASRAIARTWRAGDEVVVTALDHDANVAPWMLAAEDRGAVVRVLRCDPADCSLSAAGLAALVNGRTRLVALTCASNAVGTIVDLAPLIAVARAAGALVYLDAVHLAPHAPIDVRALDCDFLACSAYKFGGPHLGILYGRRDHLQTLAPYKVRPATDVPPGKWETGTQNFEAMAGLRACLGYLASLGTVADGGAGGPPTRDALVRAMQRIREHELSISRRFLERVRELPGVRVHGVTDPADAGRRTPTFGLTLATCTPRQAAQRLGERGVFAWDGHFYAVTLIEDLGLATSGGLLRIGFAHYNTLGEVDRLVTELRRLA